MFLLRTAFWLSVVVLLLPADRESGEPAPRVTAFEAISAAQGAVSDFSQFCERNPDVCVTGGAAFTVFADKFRYGAKMIYGYFGDDRTNSDAPVPASGTLKPDDVAPAWRDPKGEKSA